jgi:hypothetical protein
MFVGKPEEKYHLEGWEVILQMDQDGNYGRHSPGWRQESVALPVNMVMRLWISKKGED